MVQISLETSGKMLTTLGTREFGQSLMTAAHEMLGADYCSLFAFDTGQSPVCLATNGNGSDRLATFAAEKYTNKHWKADPTVVELKAGSHLDSLFIRGLSPDRLSGAYRRDCFETLKIGDRVTFLFGGSTRFLRLSFYRNIANPTFNENEVGIARAAGDFFRSTAARHHSLIARAGMDHMGMFPSRKAMRARLATLHLGLSSREIDVCALILRGVSTDGIALELGVAKSSVITYRKRAYAKLGISTQGQLFAACLSLNAECVVN